MKNPSLTVFILCLASPAHADRLSDALSPQQQVEMDLHWKYNSNLMSLDETRFQTMAAQARRVEIRLDTANYLGEQARIFLELPVVIRGLDNPAGMRLNWTTNGLLAGGSVTPGTRTLVYEGVISQTVLADVFDFTMEIDARLVNEGIRFEPVYEIEITSP